MKSASEGTDLHEALTEWLLGKDITTKNTFTLTRIKPLQKFLSKEIKLLIGCDVMLFSDELEAAGTFDLLYVDQFYNLVMTDFKTAKYQKKEEWIEDYKLQISFYSKMFEENHQKLKINNGLILFSYQDLSYECLFFEPNKYYEVIKQRVNSFKYKRKI